MNVYLRFIGYDNILRFHGQIAHLKSHGCSTIISMRQTRELARWSCIKSRTAQVGLRVCFVVPLVMEVMRGVGTPPMN